MKFIHSACKATKEELLLLEQIHEMRRITSKKGSN
jgi:hypothetical protein